MTISRGKIIKRTWRWNGVKRVAYYFDVIVEGKRTRKQFPNRVEAQEALDQFREDARTRKPALATLTFAEGVERYLKAKARRKSVGEQQRVLAAFAAYFGAETLLSDITADRISAWKEARLATKSRQRAGALLSLASVNRPLAVLRGLLRMAHDEWAALPDVPRVKTERGETARLRWLTPEEAQRLLGACRASRNADLADLVELALFTGMRQGELLGLTWDRVDRSRGVLLVTQTKNGKDREVPLNARADAVLARRGPQDAGLVFGTDCFDGFRTAWETAVRKARLVDVRFHDLRHTFASWAIQHGATLPELKDLLGHSSLAMVLRYAHLAPEHLRSAVSRLDAVLAAPADGTRTAHEEVSVA
jgi:integrase